MADDVKVPRTATRWMTYRHTIGANTVYSVFRSKLSCLRYLPRNGLIDALDESDAS